MTAEEALAAIGRGEPIEVSADEIGRFLALIGPCPNCAQRPCECKPSPCCGALWNPQDFLKEAACYLCGRAHAAER